MIAPEYFNNHVSVEGEIIVKSVPNDAGFVLVWNPTTKKISRRTHAEIATDLGLVTASNEAFFNRNRIRSETISSVPVSLDAYLPQGGFISSYNTSSWGGSDRPINASYGGYIKFSDGNNDFNNLELYYNNGHNTPDTHRLWFRTKNNLGSTNWFEAYHSGNLNPDNFIQMTHPVNNITQTNINNWLPYKAYEDNRGIAPNHLGTQSFQYGFGSWNNNNNYPYADYLHFGGYQDGSGGNQNLIIFNKNGFGFRQYQSSPQNSNLYTDYIDYWHTGNFNQGYVDEWINKANEGIVSIPMLADYVKTSTNQQIGDLKTFTGAYTSWLLDGNSSTNAHGFLQSVQDSFLLGSLNDKNVVLYRNSIHKIVVANDYTQFIDRIQAPFASIVQNDLSPYGNYVGLESSSQDGNRIYLGGVADTVGSYIGQAKYVTSNQYQSNKPYASFIKFGNAGDIVFYGDVGLTTDTNYNPSEIAKIDNGGRLKINSVVVNGGNSNQFLKADGSLDSANYATSAQLSDYVTIHTPQTIIAEKAFNDRVYVQEGIQQYNLKGNQRNRIWSFREYDHAGISYFQGDFHPIGEGFSFHIGDPNDYRIFLNIDSNIITKNYGSASEWNAKVSQSQLGNYWTGTNTVDYLEANYLKLSGGTLTSGGKIKPNGDIIIQQVDVGGNATGMFWQSIDDTKNIGGIGSLTTNGNLDYLYMGWGEYPYSVATSLSVNDSVIQYKGNSIWHAGNFNPNTKANALENAKGIGFSSGNYPTANGIEYPYLYFDNGSTTSYVALATQEFTNANYHKINHSGSLANQSDSHVNKTWFDYSWAGSGSPGSVINFSGLGGYYATELFGEYGNGGNRFGLRTRNGDAAQWNDPRWIWHSGNFNPSQYVTQSSINSQLASYATLNGVQTFTNTISFSQSPVIPNGTINSHAVNLGQLYYNDRNFITDSRGAVRPPSFYDDRFAQWDFQYKDDTQVAGDAWQGVLTVAKWSNFDPSHRQEQILFTGENLKRRTAIDDDTWGPEKTIWDSGNFTPANFATASQLNDKVNRSGDTMTGALLIGNTNIGKQRVLHLAEPTLLDSYGFNFYTDTSTGLLTLHGLNNGFSNAVPILSANRGNNFVGINKENPASELDVNGYVTSNGFIKNNSSDDYFLMGGGGQLTKYSKDDSFVNSGRDFPDGTLITTNIDYSHSEGDSFLLEIKGNMYGGGIPMDTKVQGYIYADTIINQSGYSTYSDLNTIVAMNINGNLCFWFPRLWYWQGFSVKVIATGGGDLTTINRVISIDNSPEPAGTKHVKIAIYTLSTQSWVNNQGFLTSANLNGYVTQSSLNTQLGNYATLNGVQTFNNTNTFNQSPVIPNGTLGNHAVNLNQLLDVAPPYYWNYVGQPAITNRRVLREMTWNNYGNGHTIFDISSGTTPWGASKSNVDAEQPWSPSYPTLVGGNGSGTYGLRVDSARNADNLGGISAGSYATQTWVNTNYIPRSHPVFNITQANINSWNAGTGGGSSHSHFNLSYLNNIDQYLGTGQAPQFGSIKLMDSLGYGLLALEEGLIGGEIGLVDTSNKRFYAGRINEYLKYGSSIDGFEGLNMHFDAQLLGIGREIGNDEDKVQLAGDLSVDTIDIYHNSRQLILNPLYNTNGDVRHSRNAHIYIVTGNTVSLPDKPILGQRIEIFNDSDSYIEVTHGNVGTMFKIPGFCKVTGIAANKGFRFDAEPIRTRQYDI